MPFVFGNKGIPLEASASAASGPMGQQQDFANPDKDDEQNVPTICLLNKRILEVCLLTAGL